MKKILMTAYDINPYKGSEAGTGWNFVIQGARFNKIIAITRENNQSDIEKYIIEHNIDLSNIMFYYYDLPYYLRFWKKGARGSSIYFYLWQMFIPIFIKSNKIEFDIAHNVNFHADSFPTFLWVFHKPVIWGPINHNEKIPKQYILSKREYIKDRIKWVIKNFNWRLDPFMQLAKWKVNLIIGGNSSIQLRLDLDNRKFLHLSQVGAHAHTKYVKPQKLENEFNFLVVGRFLTIKSFDIAVKAFDQFYNKLSSFEKNNIKLRIIGQGPLEKSLRSIIGKLDSKSSIQLEGWVNKDEIDNIYRDSSVFVFPSHEGAGMVTIEALSHGLPVICFDNYGAGEFVNGDCAIKIEYSTYLNSVQSFANAFLKLYSNKDLYSNMSKSAVAHFENSYSWEQKGLELERIYSLY
ncbi:glycosyltransferase family 4 protein [Salegentibacter holothuriorum]|nr:glycosyltransferase family 4 protein [Salegentibacter holothuriorum]